MVNTTDASTSIRMPSSPGFTPSSPSGLPLDDDDYHPSYIEEVVDAYRQEANRAKKVMEPDETMEEEEEALPRHTSRGARQRGPPPSSPSEPPRQRVRLEEEGHNQANEAAEAAAAVAGVDDLLCHEEQPPLSVSNELRKFLYRSSIIIIIIYVY